jgi:hypothetical protein
MNRDFEFKQLLRAYRAGIITEETFECEMSALENGNGANGKADKTFCVMGKTFPNERAGVAAMLDRFRAGEANGEAAFLAWSKLCTTDCIRSGIRMIAEREGYHARIFERRMKDLGLPCTAEVTEASRKITEYLGDANVSDNQKLLYLNALAPDIDAFFKPVVEISANIKEDMESMELFKLYVQDELSSARWLQYACEALNGAGNSTAAQSMPATSGAADSIV